MELCPDALLLCFLLLQAADAERHRLEEKRHGLQRLALVLRDVEIHSRGFLEGGREAQDAGLLREAQAGTLGTPRWTVGAHLLEDL